MTKSELQVVESAAPSRAAENWGATQTMIPADSERKPLLLLVLARRWWVLCLCAVVSGGVAYWAATEFGSMTAEVEGRLIYKGLPIPPGPKVYEAPSLETYREVLFSTPSMQKVADKHGLGVPPAMLSNFFNSKVSRGSSIMEVGLSWADPEDGIEMLNFLMQLLIDEAAKQRVQVLREHMKHVEVQQLSAKSEVDNATERLRIARQQELEALNSGGVASSRHASTLERVNTVQAAIDEKKVEMLGIREQILRVDERAGGELADLKAWVLDSALAAVKAKAKKYSSGSEQWNRLRGIYASLLEEKSATETEPEEDQSEGSPPQGYAEWKAEVDQVIGDELEPDYLDQAAISSVKSSLSALSAQHERLEMSLIPIENQLELLEDRKAEYEKAAEGFAGEVTLLAANSVADYERALETAESKQRIVEQQLDNMRQLEKCRTREFDVVVPASMETTVVSSNKKKLFVLAFAVALATLSAPVVLVEALRERESPVQSFASRFSLPVIANRMLKDFSSSDARKISPGQGDDDLRLLTLRIQQTVHQPGGVVMFTSLGKDMPPMELVSAVAECLAEREERVLLVDAVDPSRNETLLTVQTDSGDDQSLAIVSEGRAAGRQDLGLAEYFSRECEGVQDLIRPTMCPGVDLISRGNMPFPREAMASSCMTELFEHCRLAYTKILVVGPAASSLADVQMLAARADGIVLTADKRAANCSEASNAVRELIDLRAPLIGVVS